MRIADRRIILSPSDLIRFQGCEHATALDLRLLRGEPLTPAPNAAEAMLLQKKGHEHERRFLAELTEGTDDVAVIDQQVAFDEAARQTRDAMAAGARVIYQAALAAGNWQGYADFLERVEDASDLGPFGYEVVDTKLKRRATPEHAMQLSLYARGVGKIQGHHPAQGHVVLGTTPPQRVSLATEEVLRGDFRQRDTVRGEALSLERAAARYRQRRAPPKVPTVRRYVQPRMARQPPLRSVSRRDRAPFISMRVTTAAPLAFATSLGFLAGDQSSIRISRL